MSDLELWFKVLHHFLDKHNQGPDFVGDLTWDQFLIYLREGESPDAPMVEWFDPAQFKEMLKAQGVKPNVQTR